LEPFVGAVCWSGLLEPGVSFFLLFFSTLVDCFVCFGWGGVAQRARLCFKGCTRSARRLDRIRFWLARAPVSPMFCAARHASDLDWSTRNFKCEIVVCKDPAFYVAEILSCQISAPASKLASVSPHLWGEMQKTPKRVTCLQRERIMHAKKHVKLKTQFI
jgi:hypothetical protein